MKLKDVFILLLLTLGALLVHGYHPGAEDAEIYLPGIEKMLHPALFPFGAQFFQAHAHATLFPNLIAASIRITHLHLDVAVFLWQLISIFLFLLAAWELSGRCFTDRKARWAGVTLLAALLTLPVAGTCLYILDQYINPRNLSAFAALFAIVKVLDKKYVQATIFLAVAAAIHPLMAVFSLSYCILLIAMEYFQPAVVGFASLLPFGLDFAPPSPAYHQVAVLHPYHYLLRWQWYEWLGIIAPLGLLWWFSGVARRRQLRNLQRMCVALILYQLVYLAGGVVLSSSPRFESLARLQPMRSLYLLYVLLFLFIGGLLGEYVLKNHVWRWLVFFVPLCAGMFVAQRALFPASAHIEWPGAAPRNPWVQAFDWVQKNTPTGAIFALDPHHMDIAGEDENGFRAIAQRSRMADGVKDSGAVTMFPPNAEEWVRETQALSGWNHFGVRDFEQLQQQFGVSWVVLQKPGVAGMNCPYQNSAVLVCRLD